MLDLPRDAGDTTMASEGEIDMNRLAGKVAIVPGGCTKIGRAVVDAFVAAGTKVMVADIAPGEGFAPEVGFQSCDLRDDALFRIASMTKPVTSIACIRRVSAASSA